MNNGIPRQGFKRRSLVFFGIALLALAAVAGAVTLGDIQRTAENPKVTTTDMSTTEAKPVPERVLGNPAAPVTIIEYASLTCSHCAKFHSDVLPSVKKDFLDTGKAKLIFRDFPFDAVGLQAALLTRCVPSEQYFPFLSQIMRTQSDWLTKGDPLNEIKNMAQGFGLNAVQVETCLADKALMQGIVQTRLAGEKDYGVGATPTFIINGEKLSGSRPYADFAKAITKASGQ